MLFDDKKIKTIMNRNELCSIVRQHTKLKKSGEYYIGLCPFHKENVPSFFVNPKTNTYYCYGCGKGGNVFNFIMHVNNCSFEEAVMYLANRIYIDTPKLVSQNELASKNSDLLYAINNDAAKFYYHQLHSDAGIIADDYCKSRKLSEKIIAKFGIGYAGEFGTSLYAFLRKKGYENQDLIDSGLVGYKHDDGANKDVYYDKFWNRLMFPIMNEDNKIIGFGGRILKEGKPKYLNSQETPIFEKGKNLYGLNLARYTKFPYFIVCEGNVDVLSMHQAGFSNAVASLGTALTLDQVKLIGKYTKNVILAYDNDVAGLNAAAKAYKLFASQGIKTKLIDMSPCKDPDEFIKTYGKDKFNERLLNAEDGMRALIKVYQNEFSESECYNKITKLLIEQN